MPYGSCTLLVMGSCWRPAQHLPPPPPPTPLEEQRKALGYQCHYSNSLLCSGLFRLSDRLGIGDRGNEGHGSWGERKRKRSSHRPPRAPDFLISPFPLSFPRFLAVSPLKEPLRRRVLLTVTISHLLFHR